MTSEFDRTLREAKQLREEEISRRQLDRERAERELEQSLAEHERLRRGLVQSFRPGVDDLMNDVGKVEFGVGEYSFSFSYYKFGEKFFTMRKRGLRGYPGIDGWYDLFLGELLAQWSVGREKVRGYKEAFILSLCISDKDDLRFRIGDPNPVEQGRYENSYVSTDIGLLKEHLKVYMQKGPTIKSIPYRSSGGNPFFPR